MHFFSVSKYENVNTIIKNSNALSKFYGEHCLSIIVPEKEIKLFKSKFSSNEYKYIELINEDEYISIGKFREIFETEKSLLPFIDGKEIRLGWYYQQVLKLCFFLDKARFENIIQIDADTFLINKIKFFFKDHSIINFTPYERNFPYQKNCEEIFKTKFKKWYSCTSQIASMTIKENNFLNKKLMDYSPIQENEDCAMWISRIILSSVIKLNRTLEGALVSEQEIIGSSNILSGASAYRSICFLRWGVKYYLTPRQIYIASILGFSHVTYEEWMIKSKKNCFSIIEFIILLFRAKLVYLIRPKYNFLYFIWLKIIKNFKN